MINLKSKCYLLLASFISIAIVLGNGLIYGEQDKNECSLIESKFQGIEHRIDQLEKEIDDLMWYSKVGDVAFIDKVIMVGPPVAKVSNPDGMGAKNPLKFWAYIFIPKGINEDKKYPLLVFPHGGVHANFTTYYSHIIRELIWQGYIIVAPEYRGSTGYGKEFYEKIDYGGLEIEDAYSSRNYMIENYNFVDENRVGIIGWSHGGLIALMNIFEHPDDYKVAFAGVPVSDLITRLGYQTDDYRKEYSADYHIGKTVNENVFEYIRRSPVFHAAKLKTPLLIHTNTNDDDVYYIEVEHLINALKAAGKKFEYEIFKDAPGGHSFDRIDTKLAKEIRIKIYKFLAQYLHPSNPIDSLDKLYKASYSPVNNYDSKH
jgi:dipeptidyl aminopeptidase/acylaminoacyl peptidase